MRGSIEVVWPDKLSDLHTTSRPPTTAYFEQLLGGLPDIIPYWDQWINAYGVLVPATALRAGDAPADALFNLRATAYWSYVAATKGQKIQRRLTGPVVILYGDEDFMESALTS